MTEPAPLKRVLILDDDGDFRRLVKTHLSKLLPGVEMVEYDPVSLGAPSGDFNWSDYDALILDYHLSLKNITGLDILQAHRNNPSFPATIMLTGAGNEEIAARALRGGVYEYLRKDKYSKDKLKSSLLVAVARHRVRRVQVMEQTNHGRAFNQALFFQELERGSESAGTGKRLLLVLELDNSQLEQRHGVIGKDNVVRHVAKQCYEYFKGAAANPRLTRLDDLSTAILINDPGTRAQLDAVMNGLCAHLRDHPCRIQQELLPFAIGMGVIPIPDAGAPATKLLGAARECIRSAGGSGGNAYHVSSTLSPATRGTPEPVALATATPPTTSLDQTPTTASLPAAPDPGLSAPNLDAEIPPLGAAGADDIDESQLDPATLKLKQAFTGGRATMLFTPAISLTTEGQEDEREIYRVGIQLIDADGQVMEEESIYQATASPVFRKFMDRWQLREIMGHVLQHEVGRYLFLMRLSEASLADAGMFNWLRKVMTGVDDQHVGRSIVLELAAMDFVELEKPATALISYLHKSHGFRFAMGQVSNHDNVRTAAAWGKHFELILMPAALLKQLKTASDPADAPATLEKIHSQGQRILVAGIPDATALTEAITLGADMAMGSFVGDPIQELDNTAATDAP